MIDLREPKLPDCLEVDGRLIEIETDFRTWIEFGRRLAEERVAWFGVLAGDYPSGDSWVGAAVDFYRNPNETPRETGGASERAVDFISDGELITAAFQQSYGIDLTDPACEMHWHRFLALFRGLPEDTMLSRVMGYRSWTNSKKKHETVMGELKRAWALPRVGEATEDEKRRVLELFNERYG